MPIDNLSQQADDGRPPGSAMVYAEPSFQAAGHIFVGVDPHAAQRGTRYGCHMTEDEVRVLRDHLTKLLIEPDDVIGPISARDLRPTPEEAFILEAEVPSAPDPNVIQRHIDAAVARRKERDAPKRRRRRLGKPQFHIQFKWGKLGAISSYNTDDE